MYLALSQRQVPAPTLRRRGVQALLLANVLMFFVYIATWKPNFQLVHHILVVLRLVFPHVQPSKVNLHQLAHIGRMMRLFWVCIFRYLVECIGPTRRLQLPPRFPSNETAEWPQHEYYTTDLNRRYVLIHDMRGVHTSWDPLLDYLRLPHPLP